mmetsp:Transcript_13640/g.24705  ORF Transcript_13640/g.24705 Transcript_13640/m.24705 type:complete len:302 (+) Transcript_13640:108-1013(+)
MNYFLPILHSSQIGQNIRCSFLTLGKIFPHHCHHRAYIRINHSFDILWYTKLMHQCHRPFLNKFILSMQHHRHDDNIQRSILNYLNLEMVVVRGQIAQHPAPPLLYTRLGGVILHRRHYRRDGIHIHDGQSILRVDTHCPQRPASLFLHIRFVREDPHRSSDGFRPSIFPHVQFVILVCADDAQQPRGPALYRWVIAVIMHCLYNHVDGASVRKQHLVLLVPHAQVPQRHEGLTLHADVHGIDDHADHDRIASAANSDSDPRCLVHGQVRQDGAAVLLQSTILHVLAHGVHSQLDHFGPER